MTSAIVVLPLGDSITNGVAGGYRAVARQILEDDGIAIVTVGRLRDGAGAHEGRTGWSLAQWRTALPDLMVALDTIPDVCWMLLGANDAPGGDSDKMLRDAAEIIAHLRAWRIAVLVGTAIAQPANQATVDSFNAKIRTYVAGLGDSGVRIVECADVADLVDGIHPTASGYRQIGGRFADATVKYLDRGGRLVRGALAILSTVGLALGAIFHFRDRLRAR